MTSKHGLVETPPGAGSDRRGRIPMSPTRYGMTGNAIDAARLFDRQPIPTPY